MLLGSQKNKVFQAIREHGLDPAQFEWDPLETSYEHSETVEPLVHRPTGYWFRFVDEGSTWAYGCAPGRERRETSGRAGSWEYEMKAVNSWLAALRREIVEPDLWGELRRAAPAGELGEGDAVENAPFTPSELEQIQRQLEEVKHYVRQTHKLTGSQYRELESRLDYLAGAATRMPRVDWRNALAGVLLTTIVQGLLPPDAVRDALQLTLRGLAALFGHELPQLP